MSKEEENKSLDKATRDRMVFKPLLHEHQFDLWSMKQGMGKICTWLQVNQLTWTNKKKDFNIEIWGRTLTIILIIYKLRYVIGFGRIKVSTSCFRILPVPCYKVCRLQILSHRFRIHPVATTQWYEHLHCCHHISLLHYYGGNGGVQIATTSITSSSTLINK